MFPGTRRQMLIPLRQLCVETMRINSLIVRSFVLIFIIFTALVLLTSMNTTSVSAHARFDLTGTPAPQASATPPPQVSSATPLPDSNPHINGVCLGCHGKIKMQGRLANGELITLNIKMLTDQSSFHTQKGVSCTICHQDQVNYPHKGSADDSCATCHPQSVDIAPDSEETFTFILPFKDTRDLAISLSIACQKCHGDKFEQVKNSSHTKLLAEGNTATPVCVDCHTGHDIVTVDRQTVSKVCQKCHMPEYTAYKASIHGSALEKESNQDVPTCSDCHGSHDVKGPSDNSFRQTAATEICGKCHTNKAIMDKYGISTNVLTTYMDDVHGRTSLLGGIDKSGIVKATCYDCHGTHDILTPSNPYSKVYPENLQKTCQQCHKDANITFPEAWLSHKTPSMNSMPALFLTNRYALDMVGIIAGLIVLFILLDVRRQLSMKAREPENE